MFVYEPSLLMMGDPVTIVTSSLSACIGVMCFAAGLQGYLLREARPWERVLLVIAAILLIKPGYLSDLAGLALLVLVGYSQKGQKAVLPAAAVADRAK
jgi:TRAP-type uncharacterized transport system fused permease subunit